MRLLTRDDFDGLVCAALLAEKGVIDDYKFVHPRDVQNNNVDVTPNDVLANVPYAKGCGLWFDHHSSEDERLELANLNYEGDSREAPSAAQVIWDYYGGVETFGEHFLPLLEAVNKYDSADLTLDEILLAEDWIMIAFIIDPRTGLAEFTDFRIDNKEFVLDMIQYCRTKTVDEILQIPDVQERAQRYNEQQILFKDMLRRCTVADRNVVITNLLNEDTIYCGNRFIVYASHPDQNIEIRLGWDREKQNVYIQCGHSIINRTSKTNVGKMMFKYGGGGHGKVGSCKVSGESWQKALDDILEQMKQDG
jgi:oligoribonuclease NrnB/cAMP/cGMP phosphodiesterase (DHH superfamily)